MDEAEFKGWWHAAVATALGVSAAYNMMRYLSTRQSRNVANVLLYTGLCVYEWTQARCHWEQP